MLNNPLTKYIGIDYGKKRTGISISDYDKIISFPLETVETINLLNFLKDLIEKERIEKIIIGKPLKLNNKIQGVLKSSGELDDKSTQLKLEIERVERTLKEIEKKNLN